MIHLGNISYSIVFLIGIIHCICSMAPYQGEGEHDVGDCACGTRSVKQALVMDGDKVEDLRSYPWMVTLHKVKSTPETNRIWGYCGGALISRDTVLTVAHCIKDLETIRKDGKLVWDPNDLKIGLMGPTRVRPESKIPVSRLIVLPIVKKTPLTPSTDLAIVKLAEDVPCTEYSRPICITDEFTVEVGDELILSGFGWFAVNQFSNVLRDGVVNVVENDECKFWKTEEDKVICGRGPNYSSCYGDSGSPVAVVEEGRFYLVGLVSGGSYNCPVDSAAYFVRISYNYHFIMEHM